MATTRRRGAIPLPRYTEKNGWSGGDRHRLYAFTDTRTGYVVVRPGGSFHTEYLGPADVRPATRAEAELHWQNPLSSGWKVE